MEKFWTIEWTDDLITGEEEIDALHLGLANGANKVYEMCTNPDTKEIELERYIQELEMTLRMHFDIEANYLQRYDISSMDSHIENHQCFKDALDDMHKIKPKVLVKALMLSRLVLSYLKDHLQKYDRDFIKEFKQKTDQKE